MEKGLHKKVKSTDTERGHIRRRKYRKKQEYIQKDKREQDGMGRGDIYKNGEKTT